MNQPTMETISTVFSERVVSFYQSTGLISPLSENMYKVSVSTISPPASRASSSETSSSQSITSNSFRTSSINKEVSTINIPAVLQSYETFVFLGFTEEAARKLWTRYLTRPLDMDAYFFDFVEYAIEDEGIPDAESSEDDWIECMQAIGITRKCQDAIMIKEFEDIRYTRSCKYWLIDMMTNVYLTLEHLDENLKMNAHHIQRSEDMTNRPHAKVPTLASPTSRKPATLTPMPQNLVGESPSKFQLSPLTPTTQHKASSHLNPLVATSLGSPSAINLHTMIWRAGTKLKAEKFYNQATGALDLDSLNAVIGDFQWSSGKAYWTPQKATADRYAQWAKIKHAIVDIAIIQVAVPETLLKSLSTEYLWHSETWKQLIWLGRNIRNLPKELEHIGEKDLLIGHIASGKHSKYMKMKSYHQIKEGDILTIDENGERKMAIQWVFQSRKAREEFERQCRGKVWIHGLGTYLTPPKESD